MIQRHIFALFCLAHFTLPSGAADRTEEKQDNGREKLVREIVHDHKDAIREESASTGVPAPVIVAVIAAESANDPRAVSRKGARGLMQTRAIADRETGVSCDDDEPRCQIRKGAYYLRHLAFKRKIARWSRVFLAYNAGPENLKRFRSPEKVFRHHYVKTCARYLRMAQAALGE